MLASLPTELLRALRLTIVFAVLVGIAYPLAITAVAQLVFHDQANGSLIKNKNGDVVGSSLIGQEFTDSGYFYGRPSATTNASDATKPEPYNAQNSGGSNLGPSNQKLIDRVSSDVSTIRQREYLGPTDPVPVDLVTTSFSGLDPHISEAAALIQVHRVAGVRGLDEGRVRALVQKYLEGPSLGVFGERGVNVLKLNLALDNGEAG
jgi:K+-transporting ATPase ATPase C chain